MEHSEIKTLPGTGFASQIGLCLVRPPFRARAFGLYKSFLLCYGPEI